MKSIKEKAEAYDEALKRAKKVHKYSSDIAEIKRMEYIFPKLIESENEKMRKQLLNWFKECHWDTIDDGTLKRDDIIAWLEKQGKQKPADKIEPFDEYEGLTDFERTLADICIGWIGQELGWKQYIKDNADVLLKIAIKKFNSVQDTTFEQKPTEWSEEDEAKRNALISLVEEIKNQPLKRHEDWDGYISWLKSLKDRVQPNQEWSEEAQQIIKDAACFILSCVNAAETKEEEERLEELADKLQDLRPQNGYNPYKEVVESIAEMCKHYDKASHSGLRDFYDNVKVKCKDAKEYDSLYPQSTWKPSDGQMNALANACNGKMLYLDYLNSLYQDLKKLKK